MTLVLAAACAEPPPDETVCVDPAAVELPTGSFASPADFDRAGCMPGAMAELEVGGFWFMESPDQGKFSPGPVRLRHSCEEGVGVTLGSVSSSTDMPVVLRTDDDLFFRRQVEGDGWSFVEAYDLCGVDDAGQPFGKGVRCWSGDWGEECTERDITLVPFGALDEPQADGIELVGEYAGPAETPWPDAFTANVAVADGIAYVARGEDAVRIVDVSDPSAPFELSSFPAESDNYNDLAIVPAGGRTYLLVASQAFGVIVLDVTDPAAPVEAHRFTMFEGAGVHRLYVDPVETDDGVQYRAYLAEGGAGVVSVFDVTDPTAPDEIALWEAPERDWGIHAIFAKGDRVYANATVGGLLVLDLGVDPESGVASPQLVGQFLGDYTYSHASLPIVAGGRQVVLHGDEGYGSHLQVIDDDPESDSYMEIIGEVDHRPQVSLHNFVAEGELVYVAHYQDGLRVYDLSDPTAPEKVAHFHTWDPETAAGALLEGAVDVELDGDLIYLADTPRGLLILQRN